MKIQKMIYALWNISKCFCELIKRFLVEKLNKLGRYLFENAFILEFCKKSNLHGFSHIGNQDYTAFERF